MTWEELKEEAKKMGAEIGKSGTIYFSHLEFHEDGGIYFDRTELDEDTLIIPCVSSGRIPDKVFSIIKALQQESLR